MAAPAVVRFKFRSSSTFDTIDIGNRSSISITDLKSEIIKKKHLNLSHDFDLQFSDSLSGLEYKDENVDIPSGSSVIIKRVPATSTPLLRHDDVSTRCFVEDKGNQKISLEGGGLNDAASALDDFGFNLCSLPATNIHDHGELQSDAVEKKSRMVPRCPEGLLMRCHKLDAAIASQATPKGSSANEGSTLVMHSKPKTDEQVHLERIPGINLVTERSDMPSELKCSLCRNFFEEAVMIPCCQHSFCEKCIRVALSVNSKCPMCSSSKCKAEDLLPNVSLRQAIERFLKSQLLHNGSENNLHRHAPDGESGIQVELSLAGSVMPRHAHLTRSNQIMQNKLLVPTHMQCDPNTLEGFSEFQGENDLQNIAQSDEEASCNQKGNVHHFVAGGEARISTAPVRLKRGPRTCYMCGSPDHLIRECPVASTSHTNHWKGDVTFMGPIPACPTPYWAGTPPIARPFVNMYGGPGMMMYNGAVPSIPSFAYPAYASSMYPVYPAPSGHMKLGVGGMGPPIGNNVLQPSYAEFFESQGGNHDGYMGRDGIGHPVNEFSTRHCDWGKGVNHSDENFARRSEGNYRSHNDSNENRYLYGERQEKMSGPVGGRDIKVAQSDRSTSEKATSVSRIHSMEDRHENSCRITKITDERTQYDDDSRRGSFNRRKHDHRKSNREDRNHSRSSKEKSYSGEGRQRREESSHRSRHLEKSTKSFDREFHHDRAKSKHSNDDYEVHYCGHHDRDKKNNHGDRDSREYYHCHHDREKTKCTDDDHGEYYHGHKRKRYH